LFESSRKGKRSTVSHTCHCTDLDVRLFLKKAYEIQPSAGQLLAICDNLWKINDWTNYEAYQYKIVEDTREQLKKGETPAVVSYHALHLPFTLYLYDNEIHISSVAHTFGVGYRRNMDLQYDLHVSYSKLTYSRKELYLIGTLHSMNIKREALRKDTQFKYLQDFSPSRRIRVGYVSYDFRNHAVGIQVQSLFGLHNRSRFEVWAYNVNDGVHDAYENDVIYKKIKQEAEHMENIGGLTTEEAAKK
jgi:predicted O-linked N-acetylglucosamine transferase (SPINDLY family)